jgi:FeS assembly SUF system protein
MEPANAQQEVPMGKLTKDQVLEALKDVYDPEIPVNIVDLGLVYRVDVNEANEVEVDMTLTAPGCGMGPYIGQQAEWRIAEIDDVEDVKVNVVFDPPWTPDRISEDGKKLLGID